MNNIQKAAKKLYKQLKGNISFEAIESHLRKLGYMILFFNAPTGDAELQRYCLTEKAQNTKAFTYCGSAKIVFINNKLSAEDKFYLLLHETAHIALKHLETGKISISNVLLLDIDADAFVHYLLNPRKSSLKTVICSIIAITFVATGLIFCHYVTNIKSISAANITTQPVNTVYITSSGKKFHTDSCGAITDKATAQITRTEALKIHTPCSMCNP